jgi:hypothetical protein
VSSLLASLGSRKVETLADLHRDFQAANQSSVNYKPFYEKLDKSAFVQVMKLVFGSILAQLTPRILAPRKSSPLRGFDDIIIQDGSYVGLHEDLKHVFPSRFTKLHPAGVELHVTMSLLRQAPVKVAVAPDKEGERKFLPPPESLKNELLLVDRGYDGLAYLSEVDRQGGSFVARIRSNSNPTIVQVLSGSKKLRRQVGKPLNEALAHAAKSECADLLVQFPREGQVFRLVVTKLKKPRKDRKHTDTWLRLLTNVSTEKLSTQQLHQAYRLRWQIELFFKELKSYANLHPFCTRKKAIAEGLFWASLCAAALKRYVAHACQLNRRLAAISPRRVAMCAHTFLGPILDLIQTASRQLVPTLERVFSFLATSARRSNPARERKRGLLALNLAPAGVSLSDHL